MQINGFNPSLNMALLVGLRTYQQSSKAAAKVMEHLATGKRINRASDDPAGAAAASRLARDATDLSARLKDAERSKAVLGTADGGMSVLSDMLQELNALVVGASSTAGSSTEERRGMQEQAESILTAIDYVIHNTSFNDTRVLSEGFTVSVPDGSYGFAGVSVRSLGAQAYVPAEMTEEGTPGEAATRAVPGTVSIEDLRGVLNLVDGDTETAQRVVKGAIEYANGMRADFGKVMKFDLGSRLNVTRAELEGVSTEYSRIVDADYAVEVSALVRAQLLQQVSLASLKSIFDVQREGVMGVMGLVR